MRNEPVVEDVEEDIELREEVQARRRPGSAVVAVRIPAELLQRVETYARANEMTISDVMRSGVEQLVGSPIHFATGARIYSSTVLFGSSSLGGYLQSVSDAHRDPSVAPSITVAG